MDSRKIYFKFTGEKIEENKIKIWTDLDEKDKNVIENLEKQLDLMKKVLLIFSY